ncbi:tether containing UBX domain for GLUT4 [Lates japonicus]|uniref:Tether containing UBX domain for GLUT4 n=1 Tax=Lates japonicus TaxID=270547 RepID=A0AAD3QX78_LATJO|nr:tether containing UBX domain for GLUT4 [Lates japonicus]
MSMRDIALPLMPPHRGGKWRQREEETWGGRGGCMPRSLTLSSTSLVPEESFPPPVATKALTNTQSTAADHLQPQTNSQAPQPVRSDPSRASKWLKLPVLSKDQPEGWRQISLCLLGKASHSRASPKRLDWLSTLPAFNRSPLPFPPPLTKHRRTAKGNFKVARGGGFDEGRHGACWKHLLLHRGAQVGLIGGGMEERG